MSVRKILFTSTFFTFSGAHDGTAKVWNVNNGMMLRLLDPRNDIAGNTGNAINHSDDVLGLIWSEEKERIGAEKKCRKLFTYYIVSSYNIDLDLSANCSLTLNYVPKSFRIH